MYQIDQEISRDIAATQKMLHPEMIKLFQATEEEAEQLEMEMRAEVLERTKMPGVARAMVMFSPLLLENKAISSYLKVVKDPELRRMMPELLTAEETALMAQRELMDLDEKEVEMLIKELRMAQKVSNSVIG